MKPKDLKFVVTQKYGMKVGLVIADCIEKIEPVLSRDLGFFAAVPSRLVKYGGSISELEHYLSNSKADLFLFPEEHLRSDNLDAACEIAKKHKKWVVSGLDYWPEVGRYQVGIVITPDGKIAGGDIYHGAHFKTKLIDSERERGFRSGNSIDAINTEIGNIGIAVCYEMHFPEIPRKYARQGAKIIFNPIGWGMDDEAQYKLWTEIASTAARENGVYVAGCSHMSGNIPLAFAYAPNGECINRTRLDKAAALPIDIKRKMQCLEVEVDI